MSQNNEPNAPARAATPSDDQRGVAKRLARQLDEFVNEISEELSAISLLLGDRPLEISLNSPAPRPKFQPERDAVMSPAKSTGTTRLNQLKKRLANLRETGEVSDD